MLNIPNEPMNDQQDFPVFVLYVHVFTLNGIRTYGICMYKKLFYLFLKIPSPDLSSVRVRKCTYTRSVHTCTCTCIMYLVDMRRDLFNHASGYPQY